MKNEKRMKCPLCGKRVIVGVQEFFYDLEIKNRG